MRIVRPPATATPAATHDVVLIDGDKLAAYAMGVPDGTSPFNGHSPPQVRASRALRPEQARAASSATTPGGTPPPTAPSPSPAPGAERPTPPSVADRESIRTTAAKLGYLEPQNLDEATYPAAWFSADEAARMAGAIA